MSDLQPWSDYRLDTLQADLRGRDVLSKCAEDAIGYLRAQAAAALSRAEKSERERDEALIWKDDCAFRAAVEAQRYQEMRADRDRLEAEVARLTAALSEGGER